MSLPAQKKAETFTYGDYLTWPDDERWELIHGVAYNMSPAPSTEHQRVLLELAAEFRNFLQGKSCQAYIAPFDVRFPEEDEADEDIETVVQPDLSIICDPTKVDQKGCRGAPDLIIEVVSPSSVKKDMKDKVTLYEQHGVKEYWIVHPSEHSIEVFTLSEQGTYGRPGIYAGDDMLPVSLFPGLEVDLAIVFGIARVDDKPNDNI